MLCYRSWEKRTKSFVNFFTSVKWCGIYMWFMSWFSQVSRNCKSVYRDPIYPGKSWKMLEFEKCPRKSWEVLGFVHFYEKSWRSTRFVHNIFLMNFLFPVVYHELLPSCYARYSTSFFLVYLPVSRIKI